MLDNNLYNKAYKFAIRVVKAHSFLKREKKEFTISLQFLRSGTSIGANIAEANGAISKADFSAKISIAYKESLETDYWLAILKDTGYIDQRCYESMSEDLGELSKIMYTILKKSRSEHYK
jgi:four helix bundle protein